jgi:regulatory protein
MPEITALTVQRRRRNRVNVFLDGEYAFSLQDALAASLHPGQELDEQTIAELRRRDVVEEAYNHALNYLTYRPRSAWEVRRYLEKRGLSEETRAAVLGRLTRAGLVNDREFAQLWVENRAAHRPRGRRALRAELRQRGIANEIVESAVLDVDETAAALRVAEARAGRLSHLNRQTFRQRLYGYLQRRGFSYDVCRDVCRRVTDRLWGPVAAEHADPEGELADSALPTAHRFEEGNS